jgi:ubiquinone/menaquinone biosynthesis C-methylase UbiE
MPHERDVAAFDTRAPDYEHGWLGRLHRDIADKTLALALALDPSPRRLLDIGCGTGYLLRQAAARLPDATGLVGIDPAAGMIEAARAATADERVVFERGMVEELPFADGGFNLVFATTSFDHWSDQPGGLAESARVLAPGGYFVLADLLSLWLLPTIVTARRGHARTVHRARGLLHDAGLQPIGRHNLYMVIQALLARKTLNTPSQSAASA